MNARIITAENYLKLREALKEEIIRYRESDHCSPVNILVRSNLLAAQLQRIISKELNGIFNVRLMTFPDLLNEIENLSGVYSNGQLHPGSERVVLENIAASGRVPEYFGEVARTDGFIGFLLGSFSDLAESGCTADIAADIVSRNSDGLPERVRGVLSLYIDFRRDLHACGLDIHDRFMRACEIVRGRALDGPLYTYGFYDFNEMQYRLLMAAANKNNIVVFLPSGNDDRYRFAENALNRFKSEGIDRSVFSGDSRRDNKPFQPSCFLLEASDEEEEAAAIARMILKKINEGKISLRDIGIVYPAYENFAPLKEVLRGAGIPYFISGEPVTENNQLYRSAGLLLDILSGQTNRKKLVEFLVSAPLEVPSQCGVKSDPFLLWVRKSSEIGLVGEGGWIEENNALIEMLSKREGSSGVGEAVLSAKIVGDILKSILDARKAFEEKLTWHDMSSRLSDLFRDIFRDDSGVDDLCLFIDNFSGFDSASPPVSFSLFRRIVKALVSNSSIRRGEFLGAGVNLLTLEQARGLSFEVLFLAGLIDGNIPGGIRQDPFLKDSERARLNEVTSGNIFLQKKTERLAEQELVFTLASQSAERELICSMPMFEGSSGKKHIKSFFLESFEKGMGGRPGESGFKRMRFHKNNMPERTDEILSVDEFDYSQALLFRESSGGQFPPGRFFARSIEMLKNRRGANRFTPWDGVFESDSARKSIRDTLAEKDYSFSATSMEKYAKCPFSFLMDYLLGVESLEEPERIVSINPMQRGSIVHDLLEKLYENLEKENLLPIQMDKWSRISEILRRTAGKIFAEFSKENSVGFGFLWEIEKQEIESSVEIFLEKEVEEKEGYTPVSFEKTFGFGEGNVEVELPGNKRVRFRGRIDRVDFKGDEGFRVIDYKTGRLKGKDNDFNGGNYLQLPVYLLSASSIYGRPVESGAAEYRKVNKKDGKDSVSFSGNELENKRAEFDEILRVIISGIEDGLFFGVPSRKNCKFCPVAPVCPAGKAGIFQKKSVYDERCRDFLKMKGLFEGERDE